MATTYGPWQNHTRIEWSHSVGAESGGKRTITVYAYLRMDSSSSQYFAGSKSWSGAWGSGSGAQTYNLGASDRVQIVWSSHTVTLTSSAQTVSFTARANHYFGSTSHTLSVSVPAKAAVVPSAPSSLTVTRSSDTRHTLAWTNNSAYTSVEIYRSTNDGGWTKVGTVPSGGLTGWVDTGTVANRKYAYRVRGKNAGGTSGYSSTVTVYTSPAVPSTPTAKRSGNSIIVSGSVSGYGTHVEIQDEGSTVVSALPVGSLPWTHSTPSAIVTHRYRMRSSRASGGSGSTTLYSAWSSYSATVQLSTPPAVPTDLTPNGITFDGSVAMAVFWWTHNPLDSSDQTSFEWAWRRAGTTAWTSSVETSSQAQHLEPFPSTVFGYGLIEWRVRTKGMHPDWSPWSATATLDVVHAPESAILSPPVAHDRPEALVSWSYYQQEGRPQSSAEVELLQGGTLIEQRAVIGSVTQVKLSTRLEDGGAYTVRVRVATGSVWSTWDDVDIAVTFVPPAPPLIESAWDESTGSHMITLGVGARDESPDVVNHFTNPRLVGSGSWVETRRNRIWHTRPSITGSAGWRTASAGIVHSRDPRGLKIANTLSTAQGNAWAAYPAEAECPVSVAGDLWSWSCQVLNVGGSSVTVAAQIRNNSSAQQVVGSSVVIGPGETKTISYSGWSAGDGIIYATVRGVSLPASSEIVMLDQPILEKAPAAGTTFDGGAMPEGVVQPEDFRVRWLGAEYASESVVEGETVRGFTSGVGVVFVCSSWDGEPAGRLINISGLSNSCYTGIALPSALYGGGTLVATKHQREVISAGSGGYNLMVSTPDEVAPYTNQVGDVPSRLVFGAKTSTYRAYFGSRANAGGGDAWFTGIGLFAGAYTGPSFSGASGVIDTGHGWKTTRWTGTPDSSTSTTQAPDPTSVADVLRSTDGGATWELVADDLVLPADLQDWEGLSSGATLYRAVAYTAIGASAATDTSALAESVAAWLSGGPVYSIAARLPYDPSVKIDAGRSRSLQRYEGRSLPVAYAGQHLTRRVDLSGRILEPDDGNASIERLEELAQAGTPIHLYRDPDGRRIYGLLSDISVQRQGGLNGNVLWAYSVQLEETDH